MCQRILYIGEVSYQAALGMHHAVRTGEPAFDHVFGMPFFDYLERQPHVGALFNVLMTHGVDDRALSVVAAYDFSRAGVIVDVGGGKGALLTAILHTNLHTQGIIFDARSLGRSTTVPQLSRCCGPLSNCSREFL